MNGAGESSTLDIWDERTAICQARAEQWKRRDSAEQRFAEARQRAANAGATSPIPATCSNPDGFGALNQQLQDLGGSIETLARIRHDRDAATRRLQTAEAAELKRKALIRNIVIAAILLVIVLIVVLVVL